MDHISDFLSRYLSPYLRREKVKECVVNILSEILHVSVLPEQIVLRGDICIVSGHPSIKHQIFLNKEAILQALQQQEKTAHIKAVQ